MNLYPICEESVLRRSGRGRPRIYCSVLCRRQAGRARYPSELDDIEGQGSERELEAIMRDSGVMR